MNLLLSIREVNYSVVTTRRSKYQNEKLLLANNPIIPGTFPNSFNLILMTI